MEEILYKAHELGVFEQLMEEVKKLRQENASKDRIELYEIALENILKKIERGLDLTEK